MKFRDYPDTEMMAIDLANQLAGELTTALRSRGARAVRGAGRDNAGADL